MKQQHEIEINNNQKIKKKNRYKKIIIEKKEYCKIFEFRHIMPFVFVCVCVCVFELKRPIYLKL